MRILYITLSYLLTPVLIGVILWRGRRNRGYWKHLGQRFGLGRRLSRPGAIWVHAVSVGEVQAAAPLVRALQRQYPDRPLVITSMTPTGADRATALFGSSVDRRFVPYDLPGSVRRFFDRVRPDLAIIMETELWPNLFNECGRRGIPLVLASARISPRSVGRYRRLVSLFRETLSHGIVIAAQSQADAERFQSVGAPAARTHVTGNLKFDYELPEEVRQLGREFRAAQAGARPVWVAASTHAGEEAIALAAHRQVLRQFPEAVLLLVPRHPERFGPVAEWLEREGIGYVRRSSGHRLRPAQAVFLGDTLGELMTFYAASDVALVAGSLVPIGGHNLLEPASLGLPVLVGPHTFNSEDIARKFRPDGPARVVRAAYPRAGGVWARRPARAPRDAMGERGRAVVEGNRGALVRLLGLIEPLLEAAPSRER
ncbi:MAG: lipid IV(A) 3-deoxy-D-manno-octulosonic acid transferase [Gammaproteobacteria bacterium]|nr:lipid IV(A) 3-deoxy-D-manno-octulosonic acid transferase [Gammaproteobacteria bacterium]